MNTALIAPDAGATFEYSMGADRSPGSFRVNAWLRVRPWQASAYDMALSGAMMDEAGGARAVLASRLIQEIVADEPPRKPRFEFCPRELATHVCGSGVCGCIAPISAIRVTGVVAWTEQHLEEHRAQAARLGIARTLFD